MTNGSAAGRPAFLSTLPAGRGDRQLALGVVLGSGVIFLAATPFATLPLARVEAFIPIYQSALVILDLITAALLFGQFRFLGSWALCVLASGYLFTALMAVVHMLTFPGLFAPAGLLGAGPQSTAWLYMFWHGTFPFAVVGYALGTRRAAEANTPRGPTIVGSIAVVFGLVGGFTLLATAGQDALPAIMRGNHYAPAMLAVVSTTWAVSVVALIVLWTGRPHTVLDLWLMVVMCVWIFDIALSAVLNAGRFDLGFYAGRIYGLLGATFVLGVLLVENVMLYGRLAGAHLTLGRQARALEEIVRERTQRLAAIVENSDDAIISKDLGGMITSWNASAERIFGFRAEEAIGQSITLIIPPDRAREADDVLSGSVGASVLITSKRCAGPGMAGSSTCRSRSRPSGMPVGRSWECRRSPGTSPRGSARTRRSDRARRGRWPSLTRRPRASSSWTRTAGSSPRTGRWRRCSATRSVNSWAS